MPDELPAAGWVETPYQRPAEGGKRAQCLLCPHRCRLREGARGICRMRVVREGRVWATNYGRVGALQLDPTEKKPLFHFHPGSFLLSVGLPGCNLTCSFCQNWELSQREPETVRIAPEELAERTVKLQADVPQTVGIAYTYAEPLMAFEYVRDAAAAARARGLRNCLVTNGYVSPEPRREMLALIDALNVDVKGFNASFYRRVCGGTLDPVRETVEEACAAGVHVEVTNLLIPGLNDSRDDLESLCQWLGSVSPNIPLHFSRYFPNYKLDLAATPVGTLRRAGEIAHGHLRFVYLGNAGEGEDTRCPACGELLLARRGYAVRVVGLVEGPAGGCCRECGESIPIRGKVMAG